MLTFSKLDTVPNLIKEIHALPISEAPAEAYLEQKAKESAIEMLNTVTMPAAWISIRANFSTALKAQQLEIQLQERKFAV